MQSVLSSNAAEDTQPDPINTRVEGKLGEPSAKPSSIQEEYTLLVASIKKVKAQVDLLKLLLIRSKLLTMDSAASSVEAVRLEYLSSRLMRLRQLNVIPNNSDRKTEARESYVLWCTNQRNLAVRKAKLDTEDVRKRRLSSIPQHAASSGTSTPEPKKAKGIGNIFGSDDSVRHVKFHSIDTVDGGDRRGSFFTLPEASVLADPLSITGVSMSEIMTDAGDDIIRRYKIHLNFLRDQDGLHADESVPAVAANKSHQMNRDKQVEHGDKNFVVESSPLTRSCRSVSFFSSTRSENECTLSPGVSTISAVVISFIFNTVCYPDRLEMPLNRDFVSFNFDEDQSDHLPAPQQSVISCITADLSGDSAAQLSHLESPYDEDSATISNTPSAKLQKRFSMSSTKDNFTSFVETKSSSAIRTDVIVPTVYREVNDDGAPIHNSRVLKLAAILKTFSVSSSSGVLQFEKEIETRMRRCLSFSSDAVNSKFVPEGRFFAISILLLTLKVLFSR